jgi:hypothetical protein
LYSNNGQAEEAHILSSKAQLPVAKPNTLSNARKRHAYIKQEAQKLRNACPAQAPWNMFPLIILPEPNQNQ